MSSKTKDGGRPRPIQRAGVDEVPEPVVLTNENGDGGEVEKVHLFSINDVDYHIPKRIGANLGLRYLRALRRDGEAVAVAELLERVLGDEAYTALMEYDDLTEDQLKQVMKIVTRHVMGQMEALTGN